MYTIGDPIEKKSRKSSFRVEVQYMHGDADAYTKSNWYLAETLGEDELKKEFTLLRAFTGYEYNNFVTYHMGRGPTDREKRAAKLSAMTGIEQHVCDTWLSDHDEPNASYTDAVAMAEDLVITYFDKFGVERHVTFDA